jgi:hypothetical protein
MDFEIELTYKVYKFICEESNKNDFDVSTVLLSLIELMMTAHAAAGISYEGFKVVLIEMAKAYKAMMPEKKQ